MRIKTRSEPFLLGFGLRLRVRHAPNGGLEAGGDLRLAKVHLDRFWLRAAFSVAHGQRIAWNLTRARTERLDDFARHGHG